MGRKRPSKTDLYFRKLDLPEIGAVSLWRPSYPRLLELDERWSEERPKDHENAHWAWAEIERSGVKDFFAVGDPTKEIVALWSSKTGSIKLRGGPYYRLDWMEVRPILRGTYLSGVVLGLVAARALELGCNGLVGAAFPDLAEWYKKAGAELRCPSGWRYEAGLIPFVLERRRLDELQEHANAFRR